MTNFIPSEYFGIKDSKYSSLLNEIYKLTKVYQQDIEIEEGEIEVEEDEPTSRVDVSNEIEEESPHIQQMKMKENVHYGYGNVSSFPEDLSFKPPGKDKTKEVLRENSQVMPPVFPPLHFPGLPALPPHPAFYPGIPFPPLPLSFPGSLGLPPPWTPHPHHPHHLQAPPLFLPSVPPPPLVPGLAVKGKTKAPQPNIEVYVPPDEKVQRDSESLLFPNKYVQEFKEARGFDLKILFELDTSPDRLSWIVAYMDFMAREGEPLSLCPSMYKVGTRQTSRVRERL